jgi:hypothetical protein
VLNFIKLAAVTIGPDGTVSGGSGFADPNKVTIGSALSKGVSVFMFVIGALSLIMVLVGALRYVLSGGNPQATKEAKDTILYAVVGLVIAIVSLAIIRFVTGSILL